MLPFERFEDLKSLASVLVNSILQDNTFGLTEWYTILINSLGGRDTFIDLVYSFILPQIRNLENEALSKDR
jgi:hypothetical protein